MEEIIITREELREIIGFSKPIWDLTDLVNSEKERNNRRSI
jgi:phage pi2 protein 07